MSIASGDLLTRGWTRLRASAGGNATLPANTRVMAISVTGAAAAGILRLDNAATAGASTDSIDISAPIGGTAFIKLGPNGTLFNVGLSTALSGAGALFTIYYIAE